LNADIEAKIKNAIERTNMTRELMKKRSAETPKDILKDDPFQSASIKESFLVSNRNDVDECSEVK